MSDHRKGDEEQPGGEPAAEGKRPSVNGRGSLSVDAPVRTRAGSERLAATLRAMGASDDVVEAAKQG